MTKNLIYLILTVLLAAGCSTKKDAFLNREYHNTTAHYNGYFNAREGIKAAEKEFDQQYKFDYTKPIPIFIYTDDNTASGAYPAMDKAIEKCSKVVSRHSMYIKKKERMRWIDDCYFLIGKANYYKRDFEPAIEDMEYVAKEFKESDTRFDAALWLARIYIQQENYRKANQHLALLEEDNKFPEKKEWELAAVTAEMYMKQENYSGAISALETAAPLTKKKKYRVRMYYLLGQLYQMQGSKSQASEYYAKVIDANAVYEMEFYSQINRATSFSGGNSADIKKTLNKMLRDDKNVDFQGQIYYALAELAFTENDEEAGIYNLQKASYYGDGDDVQQAKTFVRLADLFYGKKDYVNAQAYYDSTTQKMPGDFEGQEHILDRRNNLTKMVNAMNIISRQDSLMELAQMTEKQRNRIIDDIIDEIISAEEEEASNAADPNYSQNNQARNRPTSGAGGWYFYNPSMKGFGATQFKTKWGSRKLEDNWRRKSKGTAAVAADFGDLESLDQGDTSATANDLKNRNYYLKNIPLSKKSVSASNEKSAEAYYDLAMVYKGYFNDNVQMRVNLEYILSKYERTAYHPPALYELFMNHKGQQKGEAYKATLVTDFRESKYAQILLNPDFINKTEASGKENERHYANVVLAYKSKNYPVVIDRVATADTMNNEFIDRLRFMSAMSKGYQGDKAQLKKELQSFVANYPESAVIDQAKKTLELMDRKPGDDKKPDDDSYHKEADKQQTILYVIVGRKVKINTIKLRVDDFNKKYFKGSNLKVSSMIYNSDTRFVQVKGLNNLFKAKEYMKVAGQNTDYIDSFKDMGFEMLIINANNYTKMYKKKDLEGYKAYHNTL